MSEEVREIVKNLKTARVVELNESPSLLFLLQRGRFDRILQGKKIAKRYKFYFNMFERRERKEDDPQIQEQGTEGFLQQQPPPLEEEYRTSQDDKKEKEASQQPEKEKAPARRKRRSRKKRRNDTQALHLTKKRK